MERKKKNKSEIGDTSKSLYQSFTLTFKDPRAIGVKLVRLIKRVESQNQPLTWAVLFQVLEFPYSPTDKYRIRGCILGKKEVEGFNHFFQTLKHGAQHKSDLYLSPKRGIK